MRLAYQATPLTNLTILSQVAFLSDPYVTHDFFETQYQKDIEPNTFVDAEKLWSNWSLDMTAQPQVNPFSETVERLPQAQLKRACRNKIFGTPFFYESQSSAGYYRRQFTADTNVLRTNLRGGTGGHVSSDHPAGNRFSWLAGRRRLAAQAGVSPIT